MHVTAHVNLLPNHALSRDAMLRLPGKVSSVRRCRFSVEQLLSRNAQLSANHSPPRAFEGTFGSVIVQPRYHGVAAWSDQRWHIAGGPCAAVPVFVAELQGVTSFLRPLDLSGYDERSTPCSGGVTAATKADVLNCWQTDIGALHEPGCFHSASVHFQRSWGQRLMPGRLCCSARPVVARTAVIAAASRRGYATAAREGASPAVAARLESRRGIAARSGIVGDDHDWQMSPELDELWLARVDRLERQPSIQAKQQLDLRWQLGIDPSFRVKGKAIPNATLYYNAKMEDPEAITLIQTGKDYQAIGLDAVLLIEHASLPRAPGIVPTAKCSTANLHQTVMELVQEGIPVAVWETTVNVNKPKIGTRFARYRTHLVTPDSPFMVEGYSNTSDDRQFNLPTVVGVSMTSTRGCLVYVLDQSTRTVSVYEGLSDDGIWGVITADTVKRAAVHLHKPMDLPKKPKHGPDAPEMERRYVMMKRRLLGRIKAVLEYRSQDGLEGFKQALRKTTGIPQDEEIKHKPAWDASAGEWPGVRPLYLSTILQLGLIVSPGIPPLADYLVPKGGHDKSGKLVRQMLVSLLLNPPPHAVATAVRKVLKFFKDDLTFGLPPFMAGGGMDPKSLNLLLQKREGNERTFWALQRTLAQILHTALDPANSPDKHGDWDQTVPMIQQLVRDVWPALCHIMSCDAQQLSQQQVLQATQQALLDIKEVVADEEVLERSNARQGSRQRATANAQAQLFSFATSMQRYALRVKTHVIEQEVQQVTQTFAELNSAVTALLAAAQAGARRFSKSASKLPRLHVDLGNSAVWLKMPARVAEQLQSVRLSSHGQQVLMKATDRNGGELKAKNLFTCELLNSRLAAYKGAVTAANSAATRALKALTGRLAITQQELTAAVQLGILLQLLCDHSKAAKDAQWSIPLVGREEQLQAGVSEEVVGGHGAFSLQELHPYWMTRHWGSDTITNDVTLSGMMMLTGPNMAGKSTVLRSVAAAALCASVGFYIPAKSGSLVPHLDAIMLRTFSGDAPMEKLSSYAVEMHEMRYVISDACPRSLVLIDELGKGTEVELGTAIASALFQQILAKKSYGIFATHLHGLLVLLKDFDNISRYSMEVVQQQSPGGISGLVPTRRIVPGICTRSLAFDVARQQGVPERVLQRAQEDYARLLQHDECQAPGPLTAADVTTEDEDDDDIAVPEEGQQATDPTAVNSNVCTMSSSHALTSRPVTADFQQQLWRQAREVQVMLARVRIGDPPMSSWLGSKPEDLLLHESPVNGAQGNARTTGVRHLRPGHVPPPMDHHEPVVYAVRYATNIWHVGETEDIGLRWRQHQRKKHKEEILLLRPEIWYVVVNTRNSDVRKKRQAALAAAMDAAGFAQDSLYDTHYNRRK